MGVAIDIKISTCLTLLKAIIRQLSAVFLREKANIQLPFYGPIPVQVNT
jgi:hypothetical protein